MPYRRRHAFQRHDLRQLGPSHYKELAIHLATVVLSVLLAVEFAFTGIIKVLGTGTARANAAHLGISLRLSRLIGIAELAAVVGLLAGIAVKPLAILTAVAVVLLMAGALGYHLKARDKSPFCFPRRSRDWRPSRCSYSPSRRSTAPSSPTRSGPRMMPGCKAAAQRNWCARQMPTDHPADPADQPQIGAEVFLSARTVEWHRLREGHSPSQTEARPAPGFTL